MLNFLLKILSGLAGLWLAIQYISGVNFYGNWQDLLIISLILGLLNVFLRPILQIIALPLKIITLGLFGLLINMGIVWAVDIFFPELIITGILPLFWTTLIIWVIGFVLPKASRRM